MRVLSIPLRTGILIITNLLTISNVFAFNSISIAISSRNSITFTHDHAIVADSALGFNKKLTKLWLSSEDEGKSKVPSTASRNYGGKIDDDGLAEKFGGFTVKQRLREEVESPFRKVRFFFFLSSTGSALTAGYFSALSTIKAVVGGYVDAQPIEEVLQSDAINLGAAIICGVLAYREYNIGQANLRRIAKGGQLASLAVVSAAAASDFSVPSSQTQKLVDYRRVSRVLIAAGGEAYLKKMALSLNADQFSDTNCISEKLQETELIVVPVLLNINSENKIVVLDTARYWKSIEVDDSEDKSNPNFDINRANEVIMYPLGKPAWTEYLDSEIETAAEQGFDVLEKGITIIVKKNGKILRRATGQPSWGELIGAMEVLDGSKFGMPGDSEKYGGL